MKVDIIVFLRPCLGVCVLKGLLSHNAAYTLKHGLLLFFYVARVWCACIGPTTADAAHTARVHDLLHVHFLLHTSTSLCPI